MARLFQRAILAISADSVKTTWKYSKRHKGPFPPARFSREPTIAQPQRNSGLSHTPDSGELVRAGPLHIPQRNLEAMLQVHPILVVYFVALGASVPEIV